MKKQKTTTQKKKNKLDKELIELWKRCCYKASEEVSRDKLGRFADGNSGYGNRAGIKHSEETKHKMSESNKGKHSMPRTEEWKRNLSVAGMGRIVPPMSVEMRIKMSESRRGDKSPNWKGGIEPENKRIRKSVEYRLWREALFARDAWTCQKCGKKGGTLNPHHIKNFAQYPELRFAIDNGITLCKSCHMIFHNTYGQNNNTQEQLSEFLNNEEKKDNDTKEEK